MIHFSLNQTHSVTFRQMDSRNDDNSEEESEEEEIGDYTVYECPGLAPTGEMEVGWRQV